MKNKKADATILILLIILMFYLAVSFLVVNFVGIKFKEIIDSDPLNTTSAHSEISNAIGAVTTRTIDNGFVFIFSFLIIGIILSGFLIRIHPVWLFIYIIFLAVGIFLGIFLGNTYQDITEMNVLAPAIANMPKTIFIMRNSLKIMLAAGALSMIVIFAKIGRGLGGSERI